MELKKCYKYVWDHTLQQCGPVFSVNIATAKWVFNDSVGVKVHSAFCLDVFIHVKEISLCLFCFMAA